MSTAIARREYTDEEIELVKNTVAKGSTDEELALFLHQAQRSGLDPLSKQIYFVKYGTTVSIQTGVDGLRTIAQRTGEYGGQVGPYWCDMTGQWFDVWLQATPPAAAKVGIMRIGFDQPLYRVATWAEFAGTSTFWKRMPSQMLAKVAESQALRAAFPQELSGLYSSDEMDQAAPQVIDHPDNSEHITVVTPELQFQRTDGSYVETLADSVGAVVVEPESEPSGSLVAEQRRASVAFITKLIGELYDDQVGYIQKLNEHYGAESMSSLDDADLAEVATMLTERRKKVIGRTRLKRLHAMGNEVEAIMDPEAEGAWEWDAQRPVYVNQVTQGRTGSSSRLYLSEWQQIVEWLQGILDEAEESPFED